jgi:hypothetical protein
VHVSHGRTEIIGHHLGVDGWGGKQWVGVPYATKNVLDYGGVSNLGEVDGTL